MVISKNFIHLLFLIFYWIFNPDNPVDLKFYMPVLKTVIKLVNFKSSEFLGLAIQYEIKNKYKWIKFFDITIKNSKIAVVILFLDRFSR